MTSARTKTSMAEREAEWFYAQLDGRAPEDAPPDVRAAASAIEQSLRLLATYDRGALALWFTKREWPDPLRRYFGDAVSLVVRLECAAHPAVGRPVADLEREAVARLLEWMASSHAPPRDLDLEGDFGVEPAPATPLDLHLSARAYFRAAIRALGKARGSGPCRVPGTGGAQ
jgi:hypothetical protein